MSEEVTTSARITQSLHVLIVDDDVIFARTLANAIESAGFRTTLVSDVRPCRQVMRKLKPDLILLDETLPSASGFAVCHSLRKETDACILLMTRQSNAIDISFGIEMGANECLPKSLPMREVVVRVVKFMRGLSKTRCKSAEERIQVGDLLLYPERLEIVVCNRRAPLAPLQMCVLKILAAHQAEFLDTETLLSHLSREGVTELTPKALSMIILRIRRKIEPDPNMPRYLIFDRGWYGGYKLKG